MPPRIVLRTVAASALPSWVQTVLSRFPSIPLTTPAQAADGMDDGLLILADDLPLDYYVRLQKEARSVAHVLHTPPFVTFRPFVSFDTATQLDDLVEFIGKECRDTFEGLRVFPLTDAILELVQEGRRQQRIAPPQQLKGLLDRLVRHAIDNDPAITGYAAIFEELSQLAALREDALASTLHDAVAAYDEALLSRPPEEGPAPYLRVRWKDCSLSRVPPGAVRDRKRLSRFVDCLLREQQ